MRYIINILVLLTATSISAHAENTEKYERDGKSYKMTWPLGGWDGKHSLPSVFCAKFPMPEQAKDLVFAFYNNKAIYHSDVIYPDNLAATITVSTVPAGRTPEFEVARLIEQKRQSESVNKINFNISEFKTDFGPTMGARIRDVMPGDKVEGKYVPFPLVLNIMNFASARPIQTLGVTRLFVRGSNRFEVGVIQQAKQPATENTEKEMTERLTGLADELMKSLQECTASIPLKAEKTL